jgi:hypothetical protein
MALEDFLLQSAVILAEAPAGSQPPRTALGGADRSSWLVVAEGVPCLLVIRGSDLAAFGSRRNDARGHVGSGTVFFSGDPVPGGLTTRHHLAITGCPRDADDGTYAVLGVIDPNSMGHHVEVTVERVRMP